MVVSNISTKVILAGCGRSSRAHDSIEYSGPSSQLAGRPRSENRREVVRPTLHFVHAFSWMMPYQQRHMEMRGAEFRLVTIVSVDQLTGDVGEARGGRATTIT